MSPLQRAVAQRLRGQVAFTLNRGLDAPPLLLDAARRLESLDPALARETYLDALQAAQFAGALADGSLREIAEAARRVPTPTPPRAHDLLLDGFATLIVEGRPAGTPPLRRAIEAFRDDDPAATGGHRWLWMANEAALELWDYPSWELFTARRVQLAREAGAITPLPLALTSTVFVRVFAGDLAGAEAVIEELGRVVDAVGSHSASSGPLLVAAWRGREPEVLAWSDAVVPDATGRGEGLAITTLDWAHALLSNSLGRYADALAAARRAAARPVGLSMPSEWALPELIEAAARTGQPGVVGEALERLSVSARASGSDWALGLEARSRALLATDDGAEPLYREAVERLGRSGLRGELARANLVFGEWLRRGGRRVDGREQLRAAHEIFAGIGADAFAERARTELLATGERVRRRGPETLDELTSQELQIARLANDGQTNAEIGAQLFLSPRTVEWHLRKVFAKLGVTSRKELRAALPPGSGAGARL